jgi:uncharacterized protein (TIGR03032 family)
VTETPSSQLQHLWETHHAEWRDPFQIMGLWSDADQVDRQLLKSRTAGDWWDVLETTGMTLLVSREYEHLLMALTVIEGKPFVTYLPMPHPSGIAVNVQKGSVHVASTRNPNALVELRPVIGTLPRLDIRVEPPTGSPLIPVSLRFLPGSCYMHGLAWIGDTLHANSVGQNAVIRFTETGYERVWWPRCIEGPDGPIFGQNHIQLNSIAAGPDLDGSFFSASSDSISARRPGHRNYPVDGRGVIFAGDTREVIARGLTRPHSARLYQGRVWVNNSGYGELGYIADGAFVSVAGLPGWTRGLAIHRDIAFVATSRVIPRFHQYAPGLDVGKSRCGLHAVDLKTGAVLGSLFWPYGNQVFAAELIPQKITTGFTANAAMQRATARENNLYYSFKT